MNGVINVYKEKGYTSFDVVAKLRGILKIRKIGHTGTLDPDAEGVLPVCIGTATKLCEFLTDKNKVYEAVLLLGTVTDTQDLSGKIMKQTIPHVTEEEFHNIIQTFIGEYKQLPPMYSAIKINGRKLYELAREGKEVERTTRIVTIDSIEIIQYKKENEKINCNEQKNNEIIEVKIRVSCSKGTYIRTLCHDIGEKLGCGACMKSLLRVKSGSFQLLNSKTLSEIEQYMKDGQIHKLLHSVDSMFSYPKRTVKEEFTNMLQNGNQLMEKAIVDLEEHEQEDKIKLSKQYRMYDFRGEFAGIYAFDKEKGYYQPIKLFYSNKSL